MTSNLLGYLVAAATLLGAVLSVGQQYARQADFIVKASQGADSSYGGGSRRAEQEPVGPDNSPLVRFLIGLACFYGGLLFAYRSNLRSQTLKFLVSFLFVYGGIVLGLWDHLWSGLR